jgi:hypothetical protein
MADLDLLPCRDDRGTEVEERKPLGADGAQSISTTSECFAGTTPPGYSWCLYFRVVHMPAPRMATE